MVAGVRERGFRPTGIFGPLAGAAACAWLRGLRGDQFASALALAANMSAGLSETWRAGTDEWRYQTALAARSAYTAADLASQGVRGSVETFEAPRGFQYAYADSDQDLWSDRMEQRWAIEDVNLKLYPVCVFNQAAVQQVLDLRTRVHGEIREIRIRMNPADSSYPGVDVVNPPSTRAAALMSVQVCAAIAALRGVVEVPDLERSGEEEVRALARRVTIEHDDSVPSHGAQVSIHTAEGVWAVSRPAALRVEDAATAPVYEALSKMGSLNSLQAELLFNLPQLLPCRDGTRRIFEVMGARH
jgi:2-methylcitrate dehydratase PrpD